jgi:hypothetical protein
VIEFIGNGRLLPISRPRKTTRLSCLRGRGRFLKAFVDFYAKESGTAQELAACFAELDGGTAVFLRRPPIPFSLLILYHIPNPTMYDIVRLAVLGIIFVVTAFFLLDGNNFKILALSIQ